MTETRKIDSEELNATIIGLGIRLAFLGVILYLSLSIIRPFLETMVWSIVLAVALYPVFDLVGEMARRASKAGRGADHNPASVDRLWARDLARCGSG